MLLCDVRYPMTIFDYREDRESGTYDWDEIQGVEGEISFEAVRPRSDRPGGSKVK